MLELVRDDGAGLVFVTRVIEGMSVEETAELLGIKPETVKTRMFYARRRLRTLLAELWDEPAAE